MKVEITPITSWIDVLNAAKFTQRKMEAFLEPSVKFKKQMLRAEHSPLRCLMFYIDLYDIPYYVSVHLCRHVHAQPFVTTSRPDILKDLPPREEQKKTDPVNMRLLVNAQEIINISRVRLCNKAEKATRKIWHTVIAKLATIDPILASACVPNCIYRGICPEFNSCKFHTTVDYSVLYNQYMNNLTIFEHEDRRRN